MAQSFIRVGSSRALTVPAGAIRKAGFTDDTEFEFNLSPNGIEFVIKEKPVRKVYRQELSERMRILMEDPVVYSAEEIENDERLKAIIEK